MKSQMSLLEVRNLTIVEKHKGEELVKDICFALEYNTCLGIVGESGSGKSLTAKALMGLLQPSIQVTGTAFLEEKNLLDMNEREWREIRGNRICMILQNAMSAFDPLSKIGSQMIETLCENLNISKKEAKKLSIEELKKMQIKEPQQVLKKFPHQLSGGMLQRCMIAIATAVKPDIIIADEPTTALDSITQNEVVKEFQRMQRELNTAFIFISHDLGVVQKLANTVLVMKEGKQVEYGQVKEVFSHPKHSYTHYLVSTRSQLTKSFTEAMRRDLVR